MDEQPFAVGDPYALIHVAPAGLRLHDFRTDLAHDAVAVAHDGKALGMLHVGGKPFGRGHIGEVALRQRFDGGFFRALRGRGHLRGAIEQPRAAGVVGVGVQAARAAEEPHARAVLAPGGDGFHRVVAHDQRVRKRILKENFREGSARGEGFFQNLACDELIQHRFYPFLKLIPIPAVSARENKQAQQLQNGLQRRGHIRQRGRAQHAPRVVRFGGGKISAALELLERPAGRVELDRQRYQVKRHD